MHVLVAAALATGACDPSAGVLCNPEDEVPPIEWKAPARGPRQWYGGPMLLVDGVSLGLFLFMPPVGATAFVAGGPGLHLSQGRPGAAAAALGLRVGLPLAGFLVGSVTCHPPRSEEYVGPGCSWTAAMFGAAVGAIAASLIDAFALAYAPVPAAKPAEPSLAPSMSIWKGPDRAAHPALGLSARF